MTAEVGRQPWIVQGLMMVSAGTSPGVSATAIHLTVAIVLLYALLFFLWGYGLVREIRRGPETGVAATASPSDGAPPRDASGEASPPSVPVAESGGTPAKGAR